MLNLPLASSASSVRLGFLMLNDRSGAGLRDSEVSDDIVIARGWGVGPGWTDVQTTTGFGRRRIRERKRSVMGVGSGDGREAVVVKFRWASGLVSTARARSSGREYLQFARQRIP